MSVAPCPAHLGAPAPRNFTPWLCFLTVVWGTGSPGLRLVGRDHVAVSSSEGSHLGKGAPHVASGLNLGPEQVWSPAPALPADQEPRF